MRHAIDYGGGWMPMPSAKRLADRLTRLRELADEMGRPVPPVTMYAVRPDRSVLDHYASAGISRAVMMLPPTGDSVAALRDLAAAVMP